LLAEALQLRGDALLDMELERLETGDIGLRFERRTVRWTRLSGN